MSTLAARNLNCLANGFAGFLLSLGLCTVSVADDIEVFSGGAATGYRPNILFVLDYSGSMGWAADASDSTQGSRVSVLRKAMRSIIEKNDARINAGVSLYSYHSSGILWPVSDLTQNANNLDPQIPASDNLTGVDIVTAIIDGQDEGGSTATVGALMESALYFSGGRVAAGGRLSAGQGSLSPQTWSSDQGEYTGDWFQPHVSTYKSNGGGASTTYQSPITHQCQKNFVVLISDGVPTQLEEYPELTNYVGPVSGCEDLSNSIFPNNEDTTTQGNCGPEVVAKMNKNAGSAKFPDAIVNTYTIGFNIDEQGKNYLTRLATEGGGEFYPANRPQDLTDALDDIIGTILGESQSFVELSVDLNKATFSDDNRIYFPQFKPSVNSSWEGNLKGYFIDEQGLKDTNGLLATITDPNGTRFVDEAQSFWSSVVDGNEVDLGGASEKLAAADRNIYTYTAGSKPVNVPLAGPAKDHHFSVDNSALSHTLLGIPNDSGLRADLINWLHSAPMADALHSKSVPVRYGNKTVVYQATNQGLLHAFDATTPTNPAGNDHSGGEEIFAFIPPELLPNLADIRNNKTDNGHIYGLDGAVTRWHDDINKDGIVNGGDKMMLVIGMRRGGQSYYALDVSKPEHPRYMWKIEGGSIDFPKLAQSWSRMSLVTVKKQDKPERVLVFGGGYDPAVMDTATTNTNANGNSIYMIDSSGKKLWSATHGDMTYSIPSDLRVIDSDGDGYADRIYTGDLGGQIWRVDFDDINLSSSFKVSKLADLANSGFQPFFYPPSIALNGGASNEYLSVSIGSGNRANPMRATTNNKIYMIKDINTVQGKPVTGFSTIKQSDLYNASNNNYSSSNPSVAEAAQKSLDEKKGWFINLAPGEKSLSSALTFESQLMATTFSPNASGNTDLCAVQATTSRYYAVELKNAVPAKSLLKSDSDSTDSRSKVIATYGIPSSPIVVFPAGSDKVQVMVDRTKVADAEQKLRRIMWHPRN